MGALSDGAKRRAKSPKAVSPIRTIQVRENKDFARECYERGCDQPGISGASKEVNDRTYTYTPKGNPGTWSEDEQQRQAIAKKQATKALQDKDPYGNCDVRSVARDSAIESKHLVNDKGVFSVWAWLFGTAPPPGEEILESPIEPEMEIEPEFVTRAEQIRREQKALKESGDPIVDELEGKPFKFFIFF